MQTLKELIDQKIIKLRTEQLALSTEVFNCLENNQIGIFESPTGTGKTLAYVSAIVDFCIKNPGSKVIISTNTRQLQDQVLEEIQRIKQVKSLDSFSYLVVKGKSNYLWRKKIEEFFEKRKNYKYKSICDELLRQADIVDGDVEQLSESIKKQVNAIGDELLDNFRTPQSLPINQADYALRIRKKAEKANIIIVNHCLLLAYCLFLKENPLTKKSFRMSLSSIASEAETLPYDPTVSVIIDEAHNVERMARLLFSNSIAARDIILIPTALDQEGLLTKADTGYKKNFEKAKKVIQRLIKLSEEEPRNYLLISKELAKENKVLNYLSKNMKFLISFSSETLKLIPKSDSYMGLKEKGESLVNLMHSVYNALTSDKPSLSSCYLVCFSEELRYPSFVVIPPDVAGFTRNALYNFDSIVLLSGTLSDYKANGEETDFDLFRSIKSRLGIDSLLKNRTKNSIVATRIFKGFDLKELATVYLYPDNPAPPQPKENNNYKEQLEAEYLPVVAGHIRDILSRSKKALILTNAHYETEAYLRLLSGTSKKVIVHPDKATKFSLQQQIEKFNKFTEAVLITASAWEGVDIDIDTLIISRLPYPSPYEPFYLAYYEQKKQYLSSTKRDLKSAERRANYLTWERYNYDAFVRFRQGLGRAIRHEKDYCNIHIMDPRVIDKYRTYLDKNYTVVYVSSTLDNAKNTEDRRNVTD